MATVWPDSKAAAGVCEGGDVAFSGFRGRHCFAIHFHHRIFGTKVAQTDRNGRVFGHSRFIDLGRHASVARAKFVEVTCLLSAQ